MRFDVSQALSLSLLPHVVLILLVLLIRLFLNLLVVLLVVMWGHRALLWWQEVEGVIEDGGGRVEREGEEKS